MPDFFLYGATGYTGRRIAREAVERGLRPMLGGRSRESLEKLARELNCEFLTVGLDDPAVLAQSLDGVRIVLNCAGPFSKTAPPMIAACLAARAHYLDITGEIDVIEHAATQDAAAGAACVTIMPAVGFDVVPTDCLAALLAADLPDATHLALAFYGSGEVSPGTAKTAVEGAITGGRARIDGKIASVPFAWKSRTVPFADKPRDAQTIPWGDVASAFYTTGIPNIETYLAMSPRDATRMRRLSYIAPLLRIPGVMGLLQNLVGRMTPGPDDAELRDGRTEVWGEVRNVAGRIISRTLTTPNAYRLTVLSAVAAVERLLQGNVPVGFQTPACALGKEFVLSLPDVHLGPTKSTT
jgi:short subunit dehydrogenase-like uncharacterized protein